MEKIKGLIGLELLPEQMKKYVYERINQRFTKEIEKLKKHTILYNLTEYKLTKEYTQLSSYLRKYPDQEELQEILGHIELHPYTVRTLMDSVFHYIDRKTENRRKKRVQRLTKKLVQAQILEKAITGSDQDNIPYNERLWNVNYHWIPGLHTEEQLEKDIFHEYRHHAKQIGRPKDRRTPQEEAQTKVVKKVQTQAAQLQFDLTPAGEKFTKAIDANKAKKTLERKATKSQVLKVGKDNQKQLVKELVEEAQEETKKLVTKATKKQKLLGP